MEFPDELWDNIKNFIFDWKKIHKIKMKNSFKTIIGRYYTFWHIRHEQPPWYDDYDTYQEQPTQLKVPLVSICRDPESNSWILGYGWTKIYLLND
tara:strand:+ start:69 stop:353 length:285 start_codon:yes stop_codon:yes gene_type:complete